VPDLRPGMTKMNFNLIQKSAELTLQCIKCDSNISYNPLERLTFVSDVRLMTSCELTSGFVLLTRASAWSCCIFVPNFTRISSCSTETLACYESRYGLELLRKVTGVIYRKSRNFYTPPVFSAPKRGDQLEFREDV